MNNEETANLFIDKDSALSFLDKNVDWKVNSQHFSSTKKLIKLESVKVKCYQDIMRSFAASKFSKIQKNIYVSIESYHHPYWRALLLEILDDGASNIYSLGDLERY